MIRHIKAAVSGCYRSLNRTLRFVSAACFSEDVVNEMRWKKKTLQRQLRVAVTESNQSSFPLINEWLQEAAHQVTKPIDWTTSGAFPSVCLITVIPPTFAIHLHIPANEQLTGSTFSLKNLKKCIIRLTIRCRHPSCIYFEIWPKSASCSLHLPF